MKHCLFVDDSNVIRKVARHIIETFGYRVSEAESIQEALERMSSDMPHVMIVDWQMPDANVFEFIGSFRSLPPDKKPHIIYCTTEHDVGDLSKAFTAGADDFLLKPFNREVLEVKFNEIPKVAA